jgi:hypothetical protein
MKFDSFQTFYPFYLTQHRNGVCRLLHVVGSLLVAALFWTAILTQTWWLLLLLPVVGYGFAWVGHFGFEGNQPATFGAPFYSLASDWVMLFHVLIGRLPLLGTLTDDQIATTTGSPAQVS